MTQETLDQVFQQARQAGREAGGEAARQIIADRMAEVSNQLAKQTAELHYMAESVKEIKETFAASAQVRYTAIEDITSLKGRVKAVEDRCDENKEDVLLLKALEVETHDLKVQVAGLQGGSAFTRDRLWSFVQSMVLLFGGWALGHFVK